MSDSRPIICSVVGLVERRDVSARDHENVHRRLRIDIAERDRVLVLGDQRDRDFLANDTAEQTVVSHWSMRQSVLVKPRACSARWRGRRPRRSRSAERSRQRDAVRKPASRRTASSPGSIPPSGPTAIVTGTPEPHGGDRLAADVEHEARTTRRAGRRSLARAHCRPARQAATPNVTGAAPTSSVHGLSPRTPSPSPRGETLRDRFHRIGRHVDAPSSAHFSAHQSMRSRSATGTTRCTGEGASNRATSSTDTSASFLDRRTMEPTA